MKHLFAVFSLAAALAVGSQVLAHFAAPDPDLYEAVVSGDNCACPVDTTAVWEPQTTLGERVMNELSPISTAHAADIWVSAMSSNDAGATNIVTMNGKSTYKLKCATSACHSFGTTASAPAPDCSKDSRLVQTVTNVSGGASVYTYATEFENGGYTKVAARALDAGNPDCQLYIVVKNP